MFRNSCTNNLANKFLTFRRRNAPRCCRISATRSTTSITRSIHTRYCRSSRWPRSRSSCRTATRSEVCRGRRASCWSRSSYCSACFDRRRRAWSPRDTNDPHPFPIETTEISRTPRKSCTNVSKKPARIARDSLRGCCIINERRSRSLSNGALIFVPRGSNE